MTWTVANEFTVERSWGWVLLEKLSSSQRQYHYGNWKFQPVLCSGLFLECGSTIKGFTANNCIFFSLPVAFVRHLLKNTPLPYTVILMVVGLLIGLASNSSSVLDNYTKIANINPHLMLLIFLPTLIFESAFIMDVHTFKKTVFQALVLACPGLIITTALTAIMARYIFSYDWSWVTAVLFGAIFSATDPVAVVALLKDLGTCGGCECGF